MSLGTASKYSVYISLADGTSMTDYSQYASFYHVNKKINNLHIFELHLNLEPSSGNISAGDLSRIRKGSLVYILYGVDGIMTKGEIERCTIKNDLTAIISGTQSAGKGTNSAKRGGLNPYNTVNGVLVVSSENITNTPFDILDSKIDTSGEGGLQLVEVENGYNSTNQPTTPVSIRVVPGMKGMDLINGVCDKAGCEWSIDYSGTNFATDTLHVASSLGGVNGGGGTGGVSLSTTAVSADPSISVSSFEQGKTEIINHVIAVASGDPKNIGVASVALVDTTAKMMRLNGNMDVCLNADMTEAATSMTVDSSGWSTHATPFIVFVGGEFMEVTSIVGTTVNVNRGTSITAGIRTNLDALSSRSRYKYYTPSKHSVGEPVLYYGYDGTLADLIIAPSSMTSASPTSLQIGSETFAPVTKDGTLFDPCTRPLTDYLYPHRDGAYMWDGSKSLYIPASGSNVAVNGVQTHVVNDRTARGYDDAEILAASILANRGSATTIERLELITTNPENHVSNQSASWINIGDGIILNVPELSISTVAVNYRVIEWDFNYQNGGTTLKFNVITTGLVGSYVNNGGINDVLGDSDARTSGLSESASREDIKDSEYRSGVEGILKGRMNLSDKGLLFYPTDTEPPAVQGGLYFDLSENKLKYHNGTSWGEIGSSLWYADGDNLRPTSNGDAVYLSDSTDAYHGSVSMISNNLKIYSYDNCDIEINSDNNLDCNIDDMNVTLNGDTISFTFTIFNSTPTQMFKVDAAGNIYFGSTLVYGADEGGVFRTIVGGAVGGLPEGDNHNIGDFILNTTTKILEFAFGTADADFAEVVDSKHDMTLEGNIIFEGTTDFYSDMTLVDISSSPAFEMFYNPVGGEDYKYDIWIDDTDTYNPTIAGYAAWWTSKVTTKIEVSATGVEENNLLIDVGEGDCILRVGGDLGITSVAGQVMIEGYTDASDDLSVLKPVAGEVVNTGGGAADYTVYSRSGKTQLVSFIAMGRDLSTVDGIKLTIDGATEFGIDDLSFASGASTGTGITQDLNPTVEFEDVDGNVPWGIMMTLPPITAQISLVIKIRANNNGNSIAYFGWVREI